MLLATTAGFYEWKKIKMILVFLQVFITPRYKERGFLVSIVKFNGIRRNLGKSSGAFFRKKIVLFSISSREELSLKALKTSQRLTLLIASYFFLMNTHVQVLIMRTLPLAWVYPEVRNFFERKICPIVSGERENILFPEGRGGGNTYWYYKIFLEKKRSLFVLILLVTSIANLDTSCVRRKNLIKLTRLAWFSKDLRYMKKSF